jgi:hypothetical protein
MEKVIEGINENARKAEEMQRLIDIESQFAQVRTSSWRNDMRLCGNSGNAQCLRDGFRFFNAQIADKAKDCARNRLETSCPRGHCPRAYR